MRYFFLLVHGNFGMVCAFFFAKRADIFFRYSLSGPSEASPLCTSHISDHLQHVSIHRFLFDEVNTIVYKTLENKIITKTT